jgi:hypothetical protein
MAVVVSRSDGVKRVFVVVWTTEGGREGEGEGEGEGELEGHRCAEVRKRE